MLCVSGWVGERDVRLGVRVCVRVRLCVIGMGMAEFGARASATAVYMVLHACVLYSCGTVERECSRVAGASARAAATAAEACVN